MPRKFQASQPTTVALGADCISFQAGDIRTVPDHMDTAALTAGCSPVRETDSVTESKVLDTIEETNEALDLSGISIQDAIEQLIGEGNKSHFSKLNGLPRVGPVSDIVGRKVSNEEIQQVWKVMDLALTEE